MYKMVLSITLYIYNKTKFFFISLYSYSIRSDIRIKLTEIQNQSSIFKRKVFEAVKYDTMYFPLLFSAGYLTSI